MLQHNLPIQLLKVAFYIDDAQNRILNVEWESEPEAAWSDQDDSGGSTSGGGGPAAHLEVTLADVAATLSTPAGLVWKRPKKGQEFHATLLPGGSIRLEDGREFKSPSGAAMAVAEVVSYDGWYAWRTTVNGKKLEYRHELAAVAGPAEPERAHV